MLLQELDTDVAALVGHLKDMWLRPTGSDKSIDGALRQTYQLARERVSSTDDIVINYLACSDYLVDCYERLVIGQPVRDLAEAEAGYHHYRHKMAEAFDWDSVNTVSPGM